MAQMVAYLSALRSAVRGSISPVFWEWMRARNIVVRDYVESLAAHIHPKPLPPYAPHLTPVEYAFGCAKQRELANLCERPIAEVKRYVAHRLKAMRRRPVLVFAFWQRAELILPNRHLPNERFVHGLNCSTIMGAALALSHLTGVKFNCGSLGSFRVTECLRTSQVGLH